MITTHSLQVVYKPLKYIYHTIYLAPRAEITFEIPNYRPDGFIWWVQQTLSVIAAKRNTDCSGNARNVSFSLSETLCQVQVIYYKRRRVIKRQKGRQRTVKAALVI